MWYLAWVLFYWLQQDIVTTKGSFIRIPLLFPMFSKVMQPANHKTSKEQISPPLPWVAVGPEIIKLPLICPPAYDLPVLCICSGTCKKNLPTIHMNEDKRKTTSHSSLQKTCRPVSGAVMIRVVPPSIETDHPTVCYSHHKFTKRSPLLQTNHLR